MTNQNRGTIRQLPSYLPTQEFIKNEEKLKLTVYICPAGVKTVGWGHAIEAHDCLRLGDTITEDTALQFLESDMVKAYQALFRLVHVPLTDNQQMALVSFIFNLGSGRFQASTLRQKLNRKEYKAASSEFGRWVYAHDPIKGLIKLPGLVSRRRRERMLFLSEKYESTPLKPRPGILPFKNYNKSRGGRPSTGSRPSASSMPVASRTASLWQKVAVIFVGFFKTGQ